MKGEKKLIEQCRDILKLARKNFYQDNILFPVVFIFSNDNKTEIIEATFDSDEAKNKFSNLIRRRIKRKGNVYAILFISECWMKLCDKNELKKEFIPPSKSSKSQEIIYAMLEMKSGKSIRWKIPINRQKEKVKLGKTVMMRDVDGFSGRFANFFK